MKTKILTATSTFSEFEPRPLEKLVQSGFEVTHNPYRRKLTKEEVMSLLDGVTGIIAGLEPLDGEVLRRSDLKVISRVGAGISNVDLRTAEELGIKVFSTPDAPVSAVAELTIAGMLNCLRQIPAMDRDLHKGEWNRRNGYQLEGKTVLIIGFGRIGRRVAKLLEAFDVRILAVDPFVKDAGANLVEIDEALPQADIITFHNSGEECILNRERFGQLKDNVIICNAARGGLIDESALEDALKEKRILACWLDTFEQEPYKGKLARFDNVILTPHVGSFTRECRVKMEMQAVDNLIKVLG